MGIMLASYASVGSHINTVLLGVRDPGLLQSLQAPLSHVLKPRPPSEQNGRSAFPPGQAEAACQKLGSRAKGVSVTKLSI